MENIYDQINKVPACEINEVVYAVVRRYGELFPDWEIGTYSIEKKGSRNEQIDRLINFLEKLKAFP